MGKLICTLFLLASLSAFSQEIKPVETLVLSDTMVFLGIDFGIAKMVNPAMRDKAADIKASNGPEWGDIAPTMSKNNNFKFDFHKKKVIYMTDSLSMSYLKWDENFVVDSSVGLTDDQIAAEVRKYKAVPGYRLGLVFVIDKMDAVNKGLLSMYGVYINLADNSVIKSIKALGGADGPGFGKYWASAVYNAYTDLVNKNFDYTNRLKRYVKKTKKAAKTAADPAK